MGTGNLLPKTEPLGRCAYPWTYKGRVSWYKSQRLGGWMMTLSGTFLLTALLTDSLLAISVVLGATLLATLGVMLYSYGTFRRDEKREPSV